MPEKKDNQGLVRLYEEKYKPQKANYLNMTEKEKEDVAQEFKLEARTYSQEEKLAFVEYAKTLGYKG